jgi:hypothetical protein
MYVLVLVVHPVADWEEFLIVGLGLGLLYVYSEWLI